MTGKPAFHRSRIRIRPRNEPGTAGLNGVLDEPSRAQRTDVHVEAKEDRMQQVVTRAAGELVPDD